MTEIFLPQRRLGTQLLVEENSPTGPIQPLQSVANGSQATQPQRFLQLIFESFVLTSN